MMIKGQYILDALTPHATALVELYVAEVLRRSRAAGGTMAGRGRAEP